MLFNENGIVVLDRWQEASSELDWAVAGDVIVTWNLWEIHRTGLIARFDEGLGKIGLRIGSGDSFEKFCMDLPYFGLVVFDFERFTDGRPFSHATLLRNRYAFAGEIRASGDIHRDQFAQLRRVGFSSFSFGDDAMPKSIELPTSAFSEVYQGAADGLKSVREQRREGRSQAT